MSLGNCGKEPSRMYELATVCRFALGVVFVLSGFAKLVDKRRFRVVVNEYRLVPPAMAGAFAALIPTLETAAGCLLLVGLGVKLAALGVALLLATFSGAVVTNLIRGRRISCGCVGTLSDREIAWSTVVRNLVMIACAVVIVVWTPTVLALDTLITSASHPIRPSDGVALLITGTLTPFVVSVIDESPSVWRKQNALTASLGIPKQ